MDDRPVETSRAETIAPSGWALFGVVVGGLAGYLFSIGTTANLGPLVGGVVGGALANEAEYQWLKRQYSGVSESDAVGDSAERELVEGQGTQAGPSDASTASPDTGTIPATHSTNGGLQGVVLAAGDGSRLRPDEGKPTGMVEVDGKPVLTHCFEQLLRADVEELLVVVGHQKERVIEYYGDQFRETPITYVHQRDQSGLAHALLSVESYIDDTFLVILGDTVFRGNLQDVVNRHRETGSDAAFLVEEVPREQASQYGVCDTNKYGEITDVVEKPDDPPSNLVLSGFYIFTPAIFHACHLVQPSARGTYELSEAISLLIDAGRSIDAVRLEGWRKDVTAPQDQEEAERRLQSESPADRDGITEDPGP